MTTDHVLSFVIAQTWQVAVLAGIVWLVVRYATRERSHVSHMLWTLVLIKCLTPPIWSSPVGLFSRWSPTTVLNQLGNASKPSKEQSSSILPTSTISIDSERGRPETPIPTQFGTPTKVGVSRDLRPAMVIVWLGVAAVFALVGFIRFYIFLRQIRRTTIATPPEVARCVARLGKQLQLRQKVGVRVVTSSVGPAVYGLFRPVIVLPQVIVIGKTELQLEPLIAHEMIHVRRGDLFIALIQSLACSLAWFHPMVWFASRCVTIESERCCDEETIASLQCKPAIYARSLLDVLERKHLLRVAPALPGVRPVDITSARLERIMRLGQGSRRRSPWWVWCTAIVAAIAVLPGAHYAVAQPPEQLKGQFPEKAETNRVQIEDTTKALKVQNSLGDRMPDSMVALMAKSDFQFDEKADGEKSTLFLEVEIIEVGGNSPAEKELTFWLEKQTTGSKSKAFKQNVPAKAIGGTVKSDLGVEGEIGHPERLPILPIAGQQDQTRNRDVSILSKIPYINSLFKADSNSPSDGSVVQASALSVSVCQEFVTPSSEDVDNFTTSMKKLDSVRTLSRPKLICKGGQTAMVSVKENNTEPCAGFSLSLKPIELKDGDLILHYDKSTTTKTELPSASTSSKVNVPPAYRTRQIGFSISLASGKSLVVASGKTEENAPQEIVVVKVTKMDRPK